MNHTLLMIHICSAVVALLSGFLASFLRKGSGLHGAAGNIFFVSMMVMTASAAYIAAFVKPNAANVVVSLLTAYLVVTARRAGRRRDGVTGPFDTAAFVYILIVGLGGVALGFEAVIRPRISKGMPPAIYFVFGTIALLCAVSDIRILRRGGVAGAQRIARHLWRMSLALLITTTSFFPGQARQLPEWLRHNSLMYVPHILVIGSMFFWMYRVKVRKRVRRDTAIAPKTVDAAPWQPAAAHIASTRR